MGFLNAAKCCTSGIDTSEVVSMGKYQMSHKKQQEDLMCERVFTFENVTIVVEPRFKTDGTETLGSVILKLIQNEVDN